MLAFTSTVWPGVSSPLSPLLHSPPFLTEFPLGQGPVRLLQLMHFQPEEKQTQVPPFQGPTSLSSVLASLSAAHRTLPLSSGSTLPPTWTSSSSHDISVSCPSPGTLPLHFSLAEASVPLHVLFPQSGMLVSVFAQPLFCFGQAFHLPRAPQLPLSEN